MINTLYDAHLIIYTDDTYYDNDLMMHIHTVLVVHALMMHALLCSMMNTLRRMMHIQCMMI